MRQFVLTLSALCLVAACGGQALTDNQTPSPSPGADAGAGEDATADAAVPPTGDAGTTTPPTTPSAGQHFLFEVSHVNFAWGEAISGAYITDTGEIYQYDYQASAPPDAGEPFLDLVAGMTEEQVTQKHGPSPELVGKIDQPSLLEHFAMLGGARLGTLLTERACADAGDFRYVGYLYDPSTSLYTPIVLGTDGDAAVLNTAPEGEALVEWIHSLADQHGDRFCSYHANACYGDLCPGVGPCSAGTVPMRPSDTGCMQDCGGTTWCESVPDCSECKAANAACVIDQQGLVHCADWLQGCTGDITCACGGDSLCAGGSSFCHGDAASGLRCSPP